MLIVPDTSPINYLVLIEALDILPKLHEHVVIPTAVGGVASPGHPNSSAPVG